MTDDCIFCRIAAGEIPATVVDRAEGVLAIEDLTPQAPTHVLVIPSEHHDTVADLAASGNDLLLARVFATAAKIGRERGGGDGFRLVVNSGPIAGQSVEHVHVHVLAGRPLGWPPG
ncbi:MAG TPA: HIT domain-containing protein [Candidatus Acidoferrum sp.]|nr:HIT domain-containing protein [Candidatus Acidoferrum sp.]